MDSGEDFRILKCKDPKDHGKNNDEDNTEKYTVTWVRKQARVEHILYLYLYL